MDNLEKNDLKAPYVLPISTQNDKALTTLAQSYVDWFSGSNPPRLQDVCYSASLRRAHLGHRLAVTADSIEEMREQLEIHLEHGRSEHVSTGRVHGDQNQQPVFVFTGMGPQWWEMGRELLQHEPVFRDAAEACDAIFERIAGWSILTEIMAEESCSRINETQVAQPAIFVLQVGLAKLWLAMGIQPAAIVGHSVGEVAAAYFAGVLSLEDAIRVSFHRSRMQQKASGKGKMLAVGLKADEVVNILAGREDWVSIAAINSPTALTLSGDPDKLEEIAKELEEKGIFNRFLQVDVAYHSPHMESLKHELRESLQGLDTHLPTIALYSTVTGQLVEEASYGSEYWYQNIRNPVRFADAVRNLIKQGNTLFLEIGPHPVLSTSIKECLKEQGVDHGEVLTSLRRSTPERVSMLDALGALYTSGYPIEWQRLFPRGGHYVELPTYPWQRERYWKESQAGMVDRLGEVEHPLLGSRLPVPIPTWEAILNQNYMPYLGDHQIEGMVVFPGAAYVEAGLAIHSILEEEKSCILEDLEFNRVLVVNPSEETVMQWIYDEKTREFKVYSRTQTNESDWTSHTIARISSGLPTETDRVNLNEIKERCQEALDIESLYAQLHKRGLQYGPDFQGISKLWRCPGEVLAQIDTNQAQEVIDKEYYLHPTILDAAFQSLIAAVDAAEDNARVYVPVYIRQVRYSSNPGTHCWSYGNLTKRSEGMIEGDVILCNDQGDILVEVRGIQCQSLASNNPDRNAEFKQWSHKFAWERMELDTVPSSLGRWLLFTDQAGTGKALAEFLVSRGAEVTQVKAASTKPQEKTTEFEILEHNKEDMSKFISKVDVENYTGVVYLWGLDTYTVDIDPTETENSLDWLYLFQALGEVNRSKYPRLYLVTKGAQAVRLEEHIHGLAQAPLVGLGRVVSSEYPDLRCTLCDIDPEADVASIQPLAQELLADSSEDDVAWRDSGRYVHRLVRASEGDLDSESTQQALLSAVDGYPFKLEVRKVGSIESLQYRELKRRKPGSGEVEIEIHATALNFKDVLKVLKMIPDKAIENTFFSNNLGMETSGVVTQIGEGVKAYHVGEEIVASIPDCFSSYITISADSIFSVPKLTQMSHEQAASIPVIFMTAYYGLYEIARLRAGESVLIHAAAGGVGLAAIQVAQWIGAEIYATAGSPEKREYLRSLGIKHVMNSRTLDFADQIMTETDNRGVDVVLNSLPGEAIFKSLSALASFGRFVEIGKRDIVENNRLPMLPFNRNLSYSAIDLDRMMLERPELIRQLLKDVWEHFRAGDFTPPPLKMYAAAEIADAFRFMAHSKQIGKIVVSISDIENVTVQPVIEDRNPINSDDTYLITGGLGGFGIEVARWLVSQGGRHLVLVSRRVTLAPQVQQTVDDLIAQGASVIPMAVDIAQESQVAELMDTIAKTMPPLRGIFHTAGVLDDRLLSNLDEAHFTKVMDPKAKGAWLLHKYTKTIPIDSFVLFSSVSSLVGNIGQGNYVAANVFLDTLAQYRRAQGLPAMSINWGALAEVGMVAKNKDVTEHLARMGINAFKPAQAMDALARVLRWDPVQLGIMDVDWTKWKQIHPIVTSSPRFSHLLTGDEVTEQGSQAKELRASLKLIEPQERSEMLALMLAELVAETLRMPYEKVDIHNSLIGMGVDSLMAVELQTTIGTNFGIEVSMMELVKGDSIVSMAGMLLGKMGISSDAEAKEEEVIQSSQSENQ